MELTVLKKTIITALGVWDDAHADGLDNVLYVRLYDQSDGSLLASVTVPAGSSGTLIDSHRYINLSTPLVLEVGKVVQIAAYYPVGNTETNGNGAAPTTPQKEPWPTFNGGTVLANTGGAKYGAGDAQPDTIDFGGPANRYHAGSVLFQEYSAEILDTLTSNQAATKPDTPSAAPGFTEDPTWDAQAAPGTAIAGATDDQAASTRARQRAPGVPQATVPRSPSRNTYAESPSDERPAIPVTQPVIATEDLDGNLLEAQVTPALTVFDTPDSVQVAPDIPVVDEALGLSGGGLDVPTPGRRSGTPTKVPNQGSRTASLDPVPLIDYDGSVEGDALVSAPSVDASADAQLLVLIEPKVIPVGQFAAVSLLVKNRHNSASLTKLGLYVEILFKDGTRSLIVNTPRNVNIGAGQVAEASFHLQVSARSVGPATVTAAIVSSDGKPMASVQKQVVIAPEAFDGWAMGSSGPTQFTDNDRIPNEVKQLVDASSPVKTVIKGSFYEHGQPQFFVVSSRSDRITASLQANALAAEAGMTVRLRAGRMGAGEIMNLGTYEESIAPMNIQGVDVLPGTHLAALGFDSIGDLAVAEGQVFWISVEPTYPIHSPQYNFGLHLSGAVLQTVDASNAVRGTDGQLKGTLTLPWRSGVVALVNRRTTAAILLLLQDGTVDVRTRAWPVSSTLVVEPEDVIEVRHGGAYNNFSEVHSTFTVDQETA
jgi:hypothetical protein